MLPILAITLPIFLIIGLGYLATRQGMFTPDHIRGLGRFVITFALPALMFRSLAQRPLGEIVDARYLAVYGLGSLTVMLGSFAWFRVARKHGVTASTLRALGTAASNSGFIGYPVAAQFLGPVAGVALALTMVIENLVVLPVALALAEAGSSQHAKPGAIAASILANLARTPLILAILAGGAFSLLGLHLPGPIAKAVSMVADASAPVALFAIGGTLVGLRVAGMAGEIAQVASAKLLLHPLAMLGFMQIIPIANPDLRRAALVFSCIPMMSIYPILGQKYGQERFCAAALLAATTASFLTITLVLWLVDAGMPAG
ncbi:MAG: Auxin Efflux Carrier [Sphingomonas bacterium]|nr:Auxin Efflux Carrier [Sphingomonas bacterium]